MPPGASYRPGRRFARKKTTGSRLSRGIWQRSGIDQGLELLEVLFPVDFPALAAKDEVGVGVGTPHTRQGFRKIVEHVLTGNDGDDGKNSRRRKRGLGGK